MDSHSSSLLLSLNTLALSGSLWLSLWLTLAHSGSLWLTAWLTVTHSLAHCDSQPGSLWLAVWLLEALIGTHGQSLSCSDDQCQVWVTVRICWIDNNLISQKLTNRNFFLENSSEEHSNTWPIHWANVIPWFLRENGAGLVCPCLRLGGSGSRP